VRVASQVQLVPTAAAACTPPAGNWTTVAETLEAANVSWRVYQGAASTRTEQAFPLQRRQCRPLRAEWDNFDDNGFAWFSLFQKSKPGSVWWDKVCPASFEELGGSAPCFRTYAFMLHPS